MSDGLEIDTTLFASRVAATLRYTAKPIEEEARAQVKGIMKEVLKYTPPRTGNSASQAQKRAQAKMESQLTGGKGRVGIFSVLPDSLIATATREDDYSTDVTRLWLTKDGRVYGVQNRYFRPDASTSEMREHHRKHFSRGRIKQKGVYRRTEGRWVFNDIMTVRESTFRRYLREQQRKIFFYAAGFAPGLRSLGMPVPRGMSRQKTERGSVAFLVNPQRIRIEIVNSVNWPGIDNDLRRRVQWATNIQANKMERRLPYLIRAAAKRAKLSQN